MDAICIASAVGDMDDDESVEIVTGGFYYLDSEVYIAQLAMWVST